jgi:hypothetical protein
MKNTLFLLGFIGTTVPPALFLYTSSPKERYALLIIWLFSIALLVFILEQA